ncbi:MAG: MFS transporter [Christensenellales bacterium]
MPPPAPRLMQGMMRRVESGWILPGDQSNASRRVLVLHNLTANIIANLIGGNFYTGLMLLLHADDAFVGLMTIFIFGANLLQLFAPYVLERFQRRKPLMIALKVSAHLLNIVFIGLIPIFPASSQARLMLFGCLTLLVNALNAFMGPGITVWHIAHIPAKVRVAFFSLVSLMNGIGIAAMNFLASLAVDRFKAGGQELWGLEALRLLALVIAVLDIGLLLRIRELPRTLAPRKIVLKDLIIKPWREKLYLRSVLVVFMWSLCANLPGPYYQVYLLRELRIDYSYITGVAIFNVLMLILFTPVWRKIYLKYSWLKPLSVAVWMLAPHYFLLAFMSQGRYYLYPIAMIWSFLCTCGINLAFSSIAYVNLPEENQTLFIGFYATINNLGALMAATLSRAFVTSLEGLRFNLLGVTFGEKQLIMLIAGCLMFGVGFGIRVVYKKNLAAQADV